MGKPETCYRCIHLRYRGPADLKHAIDEKAWYPGRYECSYFVNKMGDLHPVTICIADKTPTPMTPDCKETR